MECEQCAKIITSDVDLLLLGILQADHIAAWWDTPVPALGNRTPQQAWEAGDRVDVLRKVVSYYDTGYS